MTQCLSEAGTKLPCARVAPIGLAGRADPSLPAAVPLLLQSGRSRTHQYGTDDRGVATRSAPSGRARRAAAAPFRRRADGPQGSRRHSRDGGRGGLYTNLITAGVLLTRERLAGQARSRSRPAFDPGRRSRERRPHRAVQGRVARNARSPAGCRIWTCRSPSMRRSIARISRTCLQSSITRSR